MPTKTNLNLLLHAFTGWEGEIPALLPWKTPTLHTGLAGKEQEKHLKSNWASGKLEVFKQVSRVTLRLCNCLNRFRVRRQREWVEEKGEKSEEQKKDRKGRGHPRGWEKASDTLRNTHCVCEISASTWWTEASRLVCCVHHHTWEIEVRSLIS